VQHSNILGSDNDTSTIYLQEWRILLHPTLEELASLRLTGSTTAKAQLQIDLSDLSFEKRSICNHIETWRSGKFKNLIIDCEESIANNTS